MTSSSTGLAACLCAMWVAGCAASPGGGGAPAEPGPSGRARPNPDYLVIAPQAFLEEVEPLLAHRRALGHEVAVRTLEELGAPDAEALRAAIERLSAESDRLRFVLLAGHPAGTPSLPTFVSKMGSWAEVWEGEPFATDHPYALFEGKRLAVGRIPARTEDEITAAVQKIVRYEAPDAGGEWQRRVMVVGAPAELGPVADTLIEHHATTLLDELLPYDYDVNVLFAKPDSPYAFRLDKLGRKIVGDMNTGALLAVYAGHGNVDSFDSVIWREHLFPIGTRRDIEELAIDRGAPMFISLTCHTGAFGGRERSIGEDLVLHPNGPVALFGSSHVSHPYPNFLFAEALLDAYPMRRTPTIGEGVVAAKLAMPERRVVAAEIVAPGDHAGIKRAHLELYNLLGDPATRLRYPLGARAELRASSFAPGATIAGVAEADGFTEGRAIVTVETERRVLRDGLVGPDRLEGMEIGQAFDAMTKNHAMAIDKVVARAEVAVRDGSAPIDVVAPSRPGKYVVKVLFTSGSRVAAGHARFEVASP